MEDITTNSSSVANSRVRRRSSLTHRATSSAAVARPASPPSAAAVDNLSSNTKIKLHSNSNYNSQHRRHEAGSSLMSSSSPSIPQESISNLHAVTNGSNIGQQQQQQRRQQKVDIDGIFLVEENSNLNHDGDEHHHEQGRTRSIPINNNSNINHVNNDNNYSDSDNDNHDVDDNSSSHEVSTVISSLPPFQGRLSQSDFSSMGSFASSLENGSSNNFLILGSHISIDDDLDACGPVPDYDEEGLIILGGGEGADGSGNGKGRGGSKKKKHSMSHCHHPSTSSCEENPLSSPAATSNANANNNNATQSKLSTYMMGMSRRHHNKSQSDASFDGSSAGESNSLSSIFESIGYLSRRRRRKREHHSRGLKKNGRGPSFFSPYRFLGHAAAAGDVGVEPTAAGAAALMMPFDDNLISSPRDEVLYRKRQARMVNLRFSILFLVLCCILAVITLSILDDDYSGSVPVKGVVVGDNGLRGSSGGVNDGENSKEERNRGRGGGGGGNHIMDPILKDHLVSGATMKDERPDIAIKQGHEATLTKLKMDGNMKSLLHNLSDNTAPDPKYEHMSLIWSVPESGFDIIRDVLTSCHSFHIVDESFQPQNAGHLNPRLFNLSTLDGIKRAKDEINSVTSFSNSASSSAIFTPLFLDSLMLFDDTHRGRAYVLLRDPVERAAERAVHNFHELTDHRPDVRDMTLEDYASSDKIENNWMVRYLSGKIEGDITLDDLEVAKYILDKKFIIGLYDEVDYSLLRFEKYFGVPSYDTKEQRDCRKSQLESFAKNKGNGSKNKNRINKEVKKIRPYIEKQNEMDLELYNYAKDKIYRRQGGKK